MRKRSKMNMGKSKKLFRKTARPVKKVNATQHYLKRGGMRL